MKIHKLDIQNFKSIGYNTINFNSNMTVIIGGNGTGKTNILDAVSFALGAFILGIDGVPNRPLKQSEKRLIHTRDVFVVQLPLRVTTQLSLLDKEYRYHIELPKGNKHPSYVNAKSIIDKAKELTANVRAGEKVNLPLMVYYNNTKFNPKDNEVAWERITTRLIGYDGALFPDIVSYSFLSWFKTIEDEIIKFKFDLDLTLYKAFTSTINSMIPVWHNIHFNWKEDDIVGQLDNVGWKTLGMLSDGYKNIIRIAGDIAYRAIKLNPHLGIDAVKKTEGVVLIDEIDMHLHPNWQKTVISDFKRTFPNIQFIVTTHSPFIVQSLKADEIINLDENQLSEDPEKLSLEENALYMGVNDVNSDKFFRKGQMAEKYLHLLEVGNNDEALAKQEELLAEFSDDPVFIARLNIKKVAKFGQPLGTVECS